MTELVLMMDNKDIILQNAKEANPRPVQIWRKAH